jgi:ornithine cyclodeaminase/alanine dehydrogenase
MSTTAIPNDSAPAKLRFLSKRCLGEIPATYADVRDIVRANLTAKASGLVQNPDTRALHPVPNSFIEAMPGFVAPQAAAGLKWISGFADNPGRGLPYISGLIILNDAGTGVPTAIMDAARVTSLRTACATAVAIDLLALDPFRRVAIIGCGVQGRAHLAMLLELFPQLEEIRLFDVIPTVAEQAGKSQDDGGRCRPMATIQGAVDSADVVVTLVPEAEGDQVVRAEWLEEGALLVPAATDFGWTREALISSGTLVVDDVEQYERARERGGLKRMAGCPAPVELCDVLVAKAQAPTNHGRARVCALNLGLAIHDVAVAAYLRNIAQEQDIGMLVEL